MAATLTNTNELTYLSFPITKFERNEDGDLVVYGKATDGSVDSDEQIVDTDFSTKAIQDWLASGANVRVQHNSQRDPAGIGIEASSDADGSTWVKTLVIEPVAQRLVEKGALRAYSVGIARPKIVRDNVARGGRIVDGQIVEISLVDRPANKNCGIQLVKSASDGTPEWVGKVWGVGVDENPAMITKSVTKTVTTTVEMPSDLSGAFSPTDMAKLLDIKKSLVEAEEVKRDMDPNVGGGTDRDKIPAADFAGQDRSFPIVTPKDVTDAATSIGRAGSDNYSSDQLKANIIRIAKRKGPSFVAALPQAWKDDMDATKAMGSEAAAGADDDEQDQDNTPTSDMTGNSGNTETQSDNDTLGDDDDDASKAAKKPKGGKKPFPGAAPAFDSTDSDGDGTDADKPGSDADDDGSEAKVKPGSSKKETAEPELEKTGAKSCPSCGKNYHADTKLKRCENCNAKLPKANKGVTAGAKITELLGVDVSSLSPEAAKALTEAVLALKGDDTVFTMKGKPTPDDGAVGAASITPVPAHREPDGPAIESLEHDMHIPTDPDGPYELEMKAAQRIKNAGAPYDLGAMHDLLCPGFHPADAMKCHPSVNLAGLDLGYWSGKAERAVYGSSFADARQAADELRHATAVKGLEPETYFGHAIDAHKAFRDANPGPANFPNPTAIKPGSFNRPVMTAGHSKPGMDYDGPNVHSVPSDSISAAQYDRGYLTGGHAAMSPSNTKSEGIVPAPVPTGAPQRAFYTNAVRDNARQAMQVLHDHIAQTFPDLCPMGAGGAANHEPMGSRPVPSPVGAVKTEAAPVEVPKPIKRSKIAKKVLKGLITIDEARKLLGEEPFSVAAKTEESIAVPEPVAAVKGEDSPEVVKAATVEVDVIKTAMAEVTGGLLAKLTELETVLKAERKRNKKLEQTVEGMAAMPDPRVQAYSAASISPPPVLKSASPVGWSVAESAERTQAALMQALLSDARTDSDPSVRERAWAKLYEMNGI